MIEFKEYLNKKIAFGRAVGLMYFDQSTGAPKGGAESRARDIGILSAEEFKMGTSKQMKGYLEELSSRIGTLDEITLAMYKECKKEYEKNINIPAEEFRAYSELVSKASVYWESAKENSDFASFAPYLKELIEYNRKFINYRGFEGHPYNTLLDDYEPGMDVLKLDEFFGKIKASIVPLLKDIRQSGKVIRRDFLERSVSKDLQKQVSSLLMDLFGYDLNRGMLRESEHPFTTDFGQNDVRITTHYHEKRFTSSLYSVIHEVGHALYEQNKMADIADTILDNGVSMGIHESQSRFYENTIGRSLPFWNSIYAELQSILGDTYADVSAREFYEAVNIAEPSLIRIEADELTYPLHIMVRYEIEKEIFSGGAGFDVRELPAIWNEKMREYLGITPPDDARGVLQDVHWSQGMFGYFPSYALGSAYAAQLYHYMKQDINVDAQVGQKNIRYITEWLKKHIHNYGMLKTPSELIRNIKGEDLNADYFIKYVNEKYREIYGIK